MQIILITTIINLIRLTQQIISNRNNQLITLIILKLITIRIQAILIITITIIIIFRTPIIIIILIIIIQKIIQIIQIIQIIILIIIIQITILLTILLLIKRPSKTITHKSQFHNSSNLNDLISKTHKINQFKNFPLLLSNNPNHLKNRPQIYNPNLHLKIIIIRNNLPFKIKIQILHQKDKYK